MQEQIGLIVRGARLSRDLSQEELAARIGITPQALSNIERGRVMPSFPTVVAAMRELSIPPAALLPLIERRGSARRAVLEAALLSAAADLSERELEIALDQIRALSRRPTPRSRAR